MLRFSAPHLLLLASATAWATVPKVDFVREVQPILAEHCTQCHGPDEGKRKADLRLDDRESAMREHKGVRAVVPGKPEESDLVGRIETKDEEEIMPPTKAHKELTSEQVALLRRWVAEGAEYKGHWAFQPIQKPVVPEVHETAWPRNEIDQFILARLEVEKLPHSPEADRYTLLRRLSLDLTGLPPTPEEIAAFQEDQAPGAYERQVNRLLGSPHFGERWGRHWLDLARYADSDGYEKDLARPYAYLYRDWVINAFNRDEPFDRFTVEQLAGDLLPGASEEQKIATGFHRQTLTNREGGVDQEEYRCKATVDRTSTTGTVWLGLSVGCAECHSHKFDPLTHQEFYQLYGFFNNATERDIPAPSAADQAAYATALVQWRQQLAAVEKPLRAYREGVTRGKIAEWEGTLSLPPERWTVLKAQRVAAQLEGSEEEFLPAKDGSIVARERDKSRTRYKVNVEPPPGTRGFRLEALADVGKGVGDSREGGFGLSEFYGMIELPGGERQRVSFTRAAVDFSDAPGAAERLIDGERATDWTVKGKTKEAHAAVFELSEPLVVPEGAKFELHADFYGTGVMSHFRLSTTTSAGPLTPVVMTNELRALLETPIVFRTPAQWETLAQQYLEALDPEGRKLVAALEAVEEKKPQVSPTTAAILVADSRATHIHIRGDFLQKGDEVHPGTPAFLPPLRPRGAAPDRLDLARWLVAPENPLTARVAVNHIWGHLFGRGLVGTENDFGNRGDNPSHPELLDWLATTFRETDAWSQKALIFRIVTSATYRQSSHFRQDIAERDALNTLLARQGRFRLEAEVVRDVNLAAGGLLDPRVGGPSFKPPLPPDMALLSYASGLKWDASSEAEQHRRGLYLHLQRTVMFPMLSVFDAPEATVSCTRRERSNTPLQALALLNNALSTECAKALARRLEADPRELAEQIRLAFELAVGRPPAEEERQRLEQFYHQQYSTFQQAPEEAKKLMGEGVNDEEDPAQAAALTTTSRVLLNLDEFITRE